MDFWEDLPHQCPPVDADDSAVEGVYRLVSVEAPTEADFKSARALGKKLPPNVDECRWASCSLMYDPKPLLKLPKFKSYKWAAKLAIPEKSGLGHMSNGNHIDYWWAKQCDIKGCIVEIIEAENA